MLDFNIQSGHSDCPLQSAHFQGFLEYLCPVETMDKAC